MARADAAAAGPRTMYVSLAWTEAHAVVPDGPRSGAPWLFRGFQGQYFAHFYLVKPTAQFGQMAPAFVNRRAELVGPQGVGKNPVISAQCCLEFVGPATFAGWAGKDEGYACRDHGCHCGWEYAYDPGEPMGAPWATPHIQITAFTEDSTANTYGLLRPMIRLGPLGDLLPHAGEEFIRHPSGHEYSLIDTVTSSDRARLGGRPTFIPQDEGGLWTPTTGMTRLADTQYRNLAKMGGRAALTTNAWDPSQHSVAQREWESAATDMYRYFVQAPKNLSFHNKRERRKIYASVYPADTLRQNGGYVDLDAIDAEAAAMVRYDAAQAERFFGNRLVQGAGKAFDLDRWKELAAKRRHDVPDGALITLGFDGSRIHDSTALIATDVAGGYQWPLGIWYPEHGEIRVDLVDAAVTQAFETFAVARMYADPFFWESWIAAWSGRWGKDKVVEWPTNRTRAAAYMLRAWAEAMRAGELSHCPIDDPLCVLFTDQVGNAVRRETGFRDDMGFLWTIEKPHSNLKIDADMAGGLSWEARNDAIAGGALTPEPERRPGRLRTF